MRYVLPFLLISAAAWAQNPATASNKSAYSDFVQACMKAFTTSGGEENPMGKRICDCTAEESKHQGVTVNELKKETAEIRKDPKYNIQNKKLLDSFHYCVISEMHDAEHAN